MSFVVVPHFSLVFLTGLVWLKRCRRAPMNRVLYSGVSAVYNEVEHAPQCSITEAEVYLMSNILTQPVPQTEAEQEATLTLFFAEMQRLNTQMQQDQAEIDRLKAETDVLKEEATRSKAESAQWLTELERLRHAGRTLQLKTRATLNQLKAMVS